ncbi:hypothetical protein [Natranaerovirga pectinivora]|uniref:hypothetical protein n=1 Tax=Natranaerovirga pectinivora TaxID=682400 RepID=UPI00104B6DB4|nr:hypothetical protein [Natranaerovirga pectinivora]
MKDEYGKIAKENMSKGGQGLQNFANLNTNHQVANDVGFGNKETYRQAEYIYNNAPYLPLESIFISIYINCTLSHFKVPNSYISKYLQ